MESLSLGLGRPLDRPDDLNLYAGCEDYRIGVGVIVILFRRDRPLGDSLTGLSLALDRDIPPVKRGDLMAVFSAGAYGMSMASRYNSIPLPAEVLVDGHTAQLIRRRETIDDLVRHEMKPTPLELNIAPSLEV